MSDNMTYREALFNAMDGALKNDARTIIFGQGVDDFKGTFGTTIGLAEKYGNDRVQDTPLSEDGIAGMCVGAAMAGMRPINIHIRADFVFLAINQIINMASKYKYMFGGHYEVPIFIRAVVGRSWGQGAQHSQSPQALFSHFPGLKVIMPSHPQRILESYPYGISELNCPVISFEHRLMYDIEFDMTKTPRRSGDQSFRSICVREGTDITIVASSIMVLEAQRAAEHLAQFGVSCDIIDIVSPTDLDRELIVESIQKTGRLLVADTSWASFGLMAEVCRLVCESAPSALVTPVGFAGMEPTPCPTAKALEDMYYPNLTSLSKQIIKMVGATGDVPLPDETSMADVYKKFKGPF